MFRQRPAAAIFLIALVAGIVLAAFIPNTGETGFSNPDCGTESTRIAASIARGHGFSSPFREPTGPSAWMPPLYPYLLAAIFVVCGVFTPAAYWVAVGFNVVVHALTCLTLFRVAGEIFRGWVAWISALSLALFPLLLFPLVPLHVVGYELFIPPTTIWYTHLSELAIVVLILLTIRATPPALYGFVWGVVALLNPTILSIAPVFFFWRLRRTRYPWRYCMLSAFTAGVCIAPWLVRNWEVFGRPVFIRDNLGVELRVGNQPGGNGYWDPNAHPDRNNLELRRMEKIGEVEYTRVAGEHAIRTIRSRPGEFAINSLRRVAYWWIGNSVLSRKWPRLLFVKYLPMITFSVLAVYGAGRALRYRKHPAVLFVAVLLFYPAVYYVTHTFEGLLYQYPIHPEMLVLATAAVLNHNCSLEACFPQSRDEEIRSAFCISDNVAATRLQQGGSARRGCRG